MPAAGRAPQLGAETRARLVVKLREVDVNRTTDQSAEPDADESAAQLSDKSWRGVVISGSDVGVPIGGVRPWREIKVISCCW